jgi:outer membrane biosynthesis protein TonB
MNTHQIFCSFLISLAFASTLARAADPEADKQQYLAKMRTAIVQNISTPCGVKPKQRIDLKVVLQESGYIQALGLTQSSGAAEFDAAVMVAVVNAQPFTLPKDPVARKSLQNLNFKFDGFGTPIPECKR